MDFITWISVGYAAITIFTALLLHLFGWYLQKSVKEHSAAVMDLVREKDTHRAMFYCNSKLDIFYISGAKKLLLASSRPYMTPLVWEEVMLDMLPIASALGGRYYLRSILNIIVMVTMGYALNAAHPDSALIQTCLVVTVIGGFWATYKGGALSNALIDVKLKLVQLRNELMLQHDYIPPIYRARSCTKSEMETWKQSIKEIERDVLLGMDPNEASNESIRRVQTLIDRSEFSEDGKVTNKPPANRVDLLMED